MKRLFLVFLLVSNLCYAGEQLPDLTEDSLPVLNDELLNLDVDNQILKDNKLDLHDKKIENVATPTVSTDGVNKSYVDGKFPVNLAGGATVVTGTLPVGNGGTGKTLVVYGTTGNLPVDTDTTIDFSPDFANTTYYIALSSPVENNNNWATWKIKSKAAGSFVIRAGTNDIPNMDYVLFGTAS